MTSGLKILVVDDDRDHADSLADLFELEDHEVTVAYSGAEAIAAFEGVDFDIAFMDVLMPKMNGVESFLEIKRIRPNAKVVMMTGYSVHQLLRQASDNGAVGVLHKPLDPKMILESLHDLVPSGIVLVAGGEKSLGLSLRKMIVDGGWSCELVTDGDTAVETVTQSDLDALVLDLDLPLIDCLGIYHALKEADVDVPTVLITDVPGECTSDMATGANLAFTGILTKPFELDDLLTKLPSLVRSDKSSPENCDATKRPANIRARSHLLES